MRVRPVLAVGAAAVALGVATTVAFALVLGGLRSPSAWAPCETPSLPGAVVNVSLADMGAMMGPGMMGPGMMGPGMMGNRQYGQMPGMGMMRIAVDRATVPAGPISLRVNNFGALTHEVVILPLAPGQLPGQRAIGADGEVDESGSMGEASRTCGGGEGDGILPASTGWTTVSVPAGRYELLCNIAGHYGAGMYTELDVTASQ